MAWTVVDSFHATYAVIFKRRVIPSKAAWSLRQDSQGRRYWYVQWRTAEKVHTLYVGKELPAGVERQPDPVRELDRARMELAAAHIRIAELEAELREIQETRRNTSRSSQNALESTKNPSQVQTIGQATKNDSEGKLRAHLERMEPVRVSTFVDRFDKRRMEYCTLVWRSSEFGTLKQLAYANGTVQYHLFKTERTRKPRVILQGEARELVAQAREVWPGWERKQEEIRIQSISADFVGEYSRIWTATELAQMLRGE